MTNSDDPEKTDEGEQPEGVRGVLRRGQNINRRDVMKVAGGTGVLAGLATNVSAQEPDECSDPGVDGPCDDCEKTDEKAQRGSCTAALGVCDELKGSRIEVEDEVQCKEVAASDIPADADKAVIKAANDCWLCDVIDPSQSQTFCIDGQHNISHIEFADCPEVEDVRADCDTLTVETSGLDSGTNIDITFALELVDGGSVLETLHSDTVTRSVDSNGVAQVTDLSTLAGDTWNRVTVSDVVVSDSGFDLLGSTEHIATPELCNPPAVTVSANCDKVVVEPANTYVEDDSLTVEVAATLSEGDQGGDSLTRMLTGGGSIDIPDDWDTFDGLDIVVTQNQLGLELYNNNLPVSPSDGDFCHPPDATADADCANVTVTAEQYAVGDELSADVIANNSATGETNVASMTGVTVTDDGSGTTLSIPDTWDTFDNLDITITHVQLNLTLFDENVSTGSLCHPPDATVDVTCSTISVDANQYAEDDALSVTADALLDGSSTGDSTSGSGTGDFDVSIPDDWDTFDGVHVTVTDDDFGGKVLFDEAVSTGSLCHPPDADVAVNCDQIVIDANQYAEDDSLSVSAAAKLDGDMTGDGLNQSGTGDFTIPIPDSWDTFDAVFVSVTDDDFGGMVLYDDTQSTGSLCHPPDVAVDATCSSISVDANQYAEDDALSVTADALLDGSSTGDSTSGSGTGDFDVPIPDDWDTFDGVHVTVTDDDFGGMVLFDGAVSTGSLCHPPDASVEVSCERVSIDANQYAEDDSLTADVAARVDGDLTGDALTQSGTGDFDVPIPDDWDTFDGLDVVVTDDDFGGMELANLTDAPTTGSGYCHPPTATVTADCDNAYAETNQYAIGDDVTVTVEAVDSGGSTVETVSSGNLTVQAVDSTTGEAVYAYADDLSDGTSWSSVDVTVTHVPLNLVLVDDETVTIDAAPCGCAPCPDGLELKFEGDEIEEGNSKTQTIDGTDYTFTITNVERKSDGDPTAVCFETSSHTFCAGSLCLTVKTGEFEEQGTVDRSGGEYCFDIDDGEEPFEDENDPVQGISHFTIRCEGDC